MYRIFLVLIGAALYFSCSSTENLSEHRGTHSGQAEPEEVFPEWFYAGGLLADSTGYSMSATAVAGDSVTAIQRAEKVSRMQLESKLAVEIEKVRRNLQQNGSKTAGTPDFIITLRNAHAAIESAAVLGEIDCARTDTGYRGFVKAEIAKPELDRLLKRGFTSKNQYWTELSSETSYKALIH